MRVFPVYPCILTKLCSLLSHWPPLPQLLFDWLQTRGGSLSSHKARYAQDHANIARLEDVCRAVQPTVAIGAAAVGGAFTDQFLKDMASFNKRPVVFALSNPTSKAECTAEQAYRLTEVCLSLFSLFVRALLSLLSAFNILSLLSASYYNIFFPYSWLPYIDHLLFCSLLLLSSLILNLVSACSYRLYESRENGWSTHLMVLMLSFSTQSKMVSKRYIRIDYPLNIF